MAQPSVDCPRYSASAQAFHWLSALAVLVAWTLGLLGDELRKGPPREIAEFAHAIAGELVVLMLVLRLVWRFVEPPPPAEASGMGRVADIFSPKSAILRSIYCCWLCPSAALRRFSPTANRCLFWGLSTKVRLG
jgi:cytochrome b561